MEDQEKTEGDAPKVVEAECHIVAVSGVVANGGRVIEAECHLVAQLT